MKVCIFCNEKYDRNDWSCPSCKRTPPSINGFISISSELASCNEGYNPKFFAELYALESQNFWFRSRNQLIIWAVQKFFPNAKNFLEIGCGTGFVLSGIQHSVPSLQVYGSEIYTTGLEFAKSRIKNGELFQMDARKIPFENEFNIIGAFDVLEHIEEDLVVLKEMRKAVSQKNGGIIITVPQHPFLWSQVDENAHHVRRYTQKELTSKVNEAGFEIIKTTSFISLLFPLMVASRFLYKRKKLNRDQEAELKICSATNKVLEIILGLEHQIIKLGVEFPMGGSLLLVAKPK